MGMETAVKARVNVDSVVEIMYGEWGRGMFVVEVVERGWIWGWRNGTYDGIDVNGGGSGMMVTVLKNAYQDFFIKVLAKVCIQWCWHRDRDGGQGQLQ